MKKNHPLPRQKYRPPEPPADFPLISFRFSFSNRSPDFLHFHDEFEIGICLAGKGLFMIEEKLIPFQKGDVFVVSRYEFHRAYSPEGKPYSWHFFLFNPHRLLSGATAETAMLDTHPLSGSRFNNRFSPDQFPSLCGKVAELVEEESKKRVYYRTRVRTLILDILIEMHRLKNLTEEAPQESLGAARETLQPALELILTRYTGPLEVGRLAAACRFSVEQFRRNFKAAFGLGALDYLNDYRLKSACRLLAETRRPVTEVAFDCGFSSLPWFNRLFRRTLGMAPREWRRRKAGPEGSA